jgi:hypothetical protein
MGELADKWSAEGRLNAFGNTPRVIEMQVLFSLYAQTHDIYTYRVVWLCCML